jgi:hypothetical protein
MNLPYEIREPLGLIKPVENSNLDNLYSKPECHVVTKAFFDIQEHRGCRHFIVEIKGHVVR